MFINYASGNMLKIRAKPSGGAGKTDFAGVAFEQRANARMFVVNASAFGVFFIFANAAGVRRIGQAAIGAAASANTCARDSIAGRGLPPRANRKRLTVWRIWCCSDKYAHSVHACW
jgi:hypothetical protein